MSDASGPGDRDPPMCHPALAGKDACSSCPALQAEVDKLQEMRAQLRNQVDTLKVDNMTLEADTARERVRAAMYARRAADLQPTLDGLSSECTGLSRELEQRQMQAEARKNPGE